MFPITKNPIVVFYGPTNDCYYFCCAVKRRPSRFFVLESLYFHRILVGFECVDSKNWMLRMVLSIFYK